MEVNRLTRFTRILRVCVEYKNIRVIQVKIIIQRKCESPLDMIDEPLKFIYYDVTDLPLKVMH